MRLAIMQPYFLPYIGYFQLMAAVDKFILLDDVNYINRGWINRNRIFVQGAPHWITVPLIGASQNRLIRDILISPDSRWRTKMLRSVESAYRNFPQFDGVFPRLETIVTSAESNLSQFLFQSLQAIADYLGLSVPIEPTSSIYEKGSLTGADRILDICRREGATTYVNATGGRALYDLERFRDYGIELRFVEPRMNELQLQYDEATGPSLSIVDLLLRNPVADMQRAISAYALMP